MLLMNHAPAVSTMASMRQARQEIERLSARARRIYLVDLLVRTVQAFTERRGTTYAAAMSYYTLFSFLPLLIFVLSIVGIILRNPETQESVTRYVLDALPTGLSAEVRQTVAVGVQDLLDRISRTEHGLLGVIALLGMAWSASTMFTALRRALNAAFGIPDRRSAVKGKAWDLAGVLGVLVLVPLTLLFAALVYLIVLFVAGLSTYLTRLIFSDDPFSGLPTNEATRLLSQVLSYATSFVVMLAIYRFAPDKHLSIRLLWPAAALAALGLEVVKVGFGIYLRRFGGFEAVYGALGTAAGFLIFVYIVAAIVIFVAVLTSVRLQDRERSA
ncbi:MAG: YihY/virulence factor BrkB family protein [Dehalococcoidia bacterium]